MGVPKFYRWLSERYPRINQLIEDDSVLPDIDHLYFDMNGVLHMCSHPSEDNGLPLKTSEEQIMKNIESHLDRCISELIKPKRSIFFAVDGVAPRAKLNQQRGRRFRAGRFREEALRENAYLNIDTDELFDSNCITPGTKFMHSMDIRLKEYIKDRSENDPAWRKLEIIYSGHDVPLEGEHKILQHIRRRRAHKNYTPNQRHCMYGQDADLIMLGLATHEPHFTLLREVIEFDRRLKEAEERDKAAARAENGFVFHRQNYQLLHLSVLREYLEVEFNHKHRGQPLDRERLVDDFIFLTFLVGNDFIPHVPSMDIAENAFDLIFDAYKSLQNEGPVSYIVKDGEIGDFDRLEKLFAIIGSQEQQVLRNRDVEQKRFLEQQRKKHSDMADDMKKIAEEKLALKEGGVENVEGVDETCSSGLSDEEGEIMGESLGGSELLDSDAEISDGGDIYGHDSSDEVGAAETVVFDDVLLDMSPSEELAGSKECDYVIGVVGEEISHEQNFGQFVPTIDANHRSQYEHNVIDTGRMPDDTSLATGFSYRDHHYKVKFNVDPGPEQDAFVDKITEEYLKGLIWCLGYYFKGCLSWSWYYPYYYGPTLIDMKRLYLKAATVTFNLDKPFSPNQQLLGCLPPSSVSILPRSYQHLLTSPDSPISDFYPRAFVEDMDGKRNHWEAVVLLKFIDERRLKQAEIDEKCLENLTPEEAARNRFGNMHYHYVDASSKITRVKKVKPYLRPQDPFKSELVPGTLIPYYGFPSLRSIPIQYVKTQLLRYGRGHYGARYKTMILCVSDKLCRIGSSHPSRLVGRTVYVNYPLMQEAKVIAVSTLNKRYSRSQDAASLVESSSESAGEGSGEGPSLPVPVKVTEHSDEEKQIWFDGSDRQRRALLLGNKKVGSAGMDLRKVHTRLVVAPVIARRTNPVTGKKEKIYSEKELDIPIQMVKWKLPHVLQPKGSTDKTKTRTPPLSQSSNQQRAFSSAIPRGQMTSGIDRAMSFGLRGVMFLGRKCKF